MFRGLSISLNPEEVMYTVNIKTLVDENTITQIVDFGGEISRTIVNTREIQLRNSLISLGWIPPMDESTSVPICDFVRGYEYALRIANEVALTLTGNPENESIIIDALHKKRQELLVTETNTEEANP